MVRRGSAVASLAEKNREMERKQNRSRTLAARALAVFGSVVVIATALFHASGYAEVSRAVDRSDLGQFLRSGFKGLWLMFSANLLLLAVFSLLVAIRHSSASRSILFVSGAVLAANTLLLFIYAGPFLGAFMLAAGSSALLVASALMKNHPNSEIG